MAAQQRVAGPGLVGGELSASLDKAISIRYIYATDMISGSQQNSAQVMQRVRVGLTGLAIVLVLIGLASVIFSSANRDAPVAAIGAPNAAVVANMTEGNGSAVAEKGKDEPLAEMGVTPSTSSTEAGDAAALARAEAARRQR